MQSFWSDSVSKQKRVLRPALRGNQKTDVLIIGAGMAGVLTAHALKARGVNCIVAEAAQIASGTTQNTTAKITAQHGLCYQKMLNQLPLELVKRYVDLNTQAIGRFKALSAENECDFVTDTAYTFTATDRAMLDRELEAYVQLGLEPVYLNTVPLPVPAVGAVGMREQARFNPMRFILSLANTLDIYENTIITDIQGNRAITASGGIEAEHIVLCTHYPFINLQGLYTMKLYQHRSYVIALEGAAKIDGMFVDEKETGYSFRMAGDMLLMGGGGHRTGNRGGGLGAIRKLAGWAYPNAHEMYHWAAQDTMSLDGRPYIGRFSKKHANWYVATGFNKWGMTGTMTAAQTLADMIVDGHSDDETLFAPDRPMLNAQLFVNAATFMYGLMHFAGPKCTHLGCRLKWNTLEQSWDCPCHGSRFMGSGKVIDNPAMRRMKV